jgi:hypothetical protein
MPPDFLPSGPLPTPHGPLPIPYPNIAESGATPPTIPRPIPKELLPPELQAILARLADKFGTKLNVTPADAEWVEISVANLPASQLHSELQGARNTLFGNAAARVQVIQSPTPSGASIFLHLLAEPNWGDIARLSGK